MFDETVLRVVEKVFIFQIFLNMSDNQFFKYFKHDGYLSYGSVVFFDSAWPFLVNRRDDRKPEEFRYFRVSITTFKNKLTEE